MSEEHNIWCKTKQTSKVCHHKPLSVLGNSITYNNNNIQTQFDAKTVQQRYIFKKERE